MENKSISKLTYEEASKELESILENLRNDEISIDKLEKVVARAAALSKFCQDKLRNTEQQVQDIIDKLGL
ncbi:MULTISPECIES: exodeoxyribonuclease VII small subunit [unclassified Polaribacter]|uniref:exodeoxyribonuclease VII small subunit n=1 Tax=unclassified Polaribacter TaxID=196858 RepID=UPI0011BD47ED|nr:MULTISPECIES: exodeoxyribonuclease VII small subunit [unclassified Polaribacter]TXD49484.1 exodeoxyribonuclease VII small subunit [Polaribacter sp. IC063]TXD56037.1 exodeoxyribonuclease VII small subunit [Polaribacter sp. IC066]